MSSSAVERVDKEEKTYDTEDIASLIQQLREKDALIAKKDVIIAEKDALLAVEKPLPSPHRGEEDDEFMPHPCGLGFEVEGSVRNGSVVATFDDYLHAQKSLRLKSQQWKGSTLFTNDGGKVRTAEEMQVIREHMLGRRGAVVQRDDSVDVNQLDGDETDEHHHTGNIAWYLPPVQRQRWYDDQTLPHVNWGDLFFDLFYVAAAYNLGVLVLAATEAKGNGGDEIILRVLLDFFGTLGPLWACWEAQTFYASRYVSNDYFHRLVEIIRYICVGTAIYNIKFVSLSDPTSDSELYFTLTMLLELIMSMGLNLELYCKAIGDKTSIKNHTLDDFRFRNGVLFAFYLAAFIIAAVQHAQSRKGQGHEGGLHPAVDGSSEVIKHENGTSHSEGHRLLHEEAIAVRDKWDIHDLPLTLTAAAFFLQFFLSGIRFHYRGRKGDVRDWYVPANIDYLIHRYGEFVMLMIGEGVLSLLIVATVETREYDIIVFCGLVTIIFLFVLKTESEPSDPSKHALWRSSAAVVSYRAFTSLLTIFLIGFGVSYKSFLHEIYHEEVHNEDVQFVLGSKVFSGCLTGVLLSLELMNSSHYGLQKSIGFLFQGDDEGKKKLNWPVAIIAVVKLGIILFCVTLFTWSNEPDTLAVMGLLIVVALSVTRVLERRCKIGTEN